MTRPARSQESRLVKCAQLLRVHEWIKNLIIFAALIFSKEIFHRELFFRLVWLFVSFCAVSSAVYILNDIVDASRDRLHPLKRARPIAAGIIRPAEAMVAAMILAGVGFGVLFAVGAPPVVMLLVAVFLGLNVLYTFYLKQKVIVDVLAIAFGYVLRVLSSGFMVEVEISHWLILCTFLLATFLGFSKRRHELVVLNSDAKQHRPVLSLYSESFLDQVSLLTLAMTLTCYALYTIAPETTARYGTNAQVYTVLIVMFALFRYLFLVHVKNMGSPVEVIYYDRQILMAIAAWLLYVVFVIYTLPGLKQGF